MGKESFLRVILDWQKGLIRDAMLGMIKAQGGWELVEWPTQMEIAADVGICDDKKKLTHATCSVPWVVCADFKQCSEIQSALHMGAKGCISIDSGWLELVKGVMMASKGKTHLCYGASQMMCVAASPKPSKKGIRVVTTREEEVLRLIAKGQTSKEIGKLLAMSPHTVETHRRNIKQKTGYHKVAELVMFAIELEAQRA